MQATRHLKPQMLQQGKGSAKSIMNVVLSGYLSQKDEKQSKPDCKKGKAKLKFIKLIDMLGGDSILNERRSAKTS